MMARRNLDEQRRAIAEAIPMGRIADPRKISQWSFFLASDEASYITGLGIVVDGGVLGCLIRFRAS